MPAITKINPGSFSAPVTYVVYYDTIGLSEAHVPIDTRTNSATLSDDAAGLVYLTETSGVRVLFGTINYETGEVQLENAVTRTGANALEEIVYGVIPQVLPLWISYSLYRFESNVRSASVVGMVGAGGIGVVLWEIIRGFQYAETCAVMIIIIVSVTVIDVISARIRKSLV